jgi:hypothetical protein
LSGYPKPRQDAKTRVLRNVKTVDTGYADSDGVKSSCWLWQGETDRNGYGRIKREGVRVSAHWVLKGDPPDGLEVDHLCRQRACVRPSHLEYVTHEENERRKPR